MQSANTDLNIEIVGINSIDEKGFNSEITAISSLPWLQDTTNANVWTDWQVEWRDLRILDAENHLVSVYNLTTHDLSLPQNLATVKELLVNTAKVVDSDKDGLPDSWERQYFGDLSAKPDEDPDGDGLSNFEEYAFGTDPTNPKSFVNLKAIVPVRPASALAAFSFHRRAGSFVKYVVETSSDLEQWVPATTSTVSVQSPRNLFDGTGTSSVTSYFPKNTLTQPWRFLRVEAVPSGTLPR